MYGQRMLPGIRISRKGIIECKVIVPVRDTVDSVKGGERACCAHAYWGIYFPQFGICLMGLRGGGIAGFVTAKCIMESNPVIRGINNGHRLGEVQIFYQDFDVQFSAGVDVHTDDEYVRVNDHCTDAIRMCRSRGQSIVIP